MYSIYFIILIIFLSASRTGAILCKEITFHTLESSAYESQVSKDRQGQPSGRLSGGARGSEGERARGGNWFMR